MPAVALANVFDSGAWRYQDGDTLNTVVPDVRLRLSSLIMIRDAVLTGAGAALIPRSLLAQDGAHASLAVWRRIPRSAHRTVGFAQLAPPGKHQGGGIRGIPLRGISRAHPDWRGRGLMDVARKGRQFGRRQLPFVENQ